MLFQFDFFQDREKEVRQEEGKESDKEMHLFEWAKAEKINKIQCKQTKKNKLKNRKKIN